MENENMTVKEVAKRMGKSEMFVRIGLRNNSFPFGSAVKGSSTWSYHISKKAFERYMLGISNIDTDELVKDIVDGIVNKIIEVYGGNSSENNK